LKPSAPNRHAAQTPSALPIEYDDVLGLEDHSRGITSVALLERYAGLAMESVEANADTLIGRSVLRALRAGERLQIASAASASLGEAARYGRRAA